MKEIPKTMKGAILPGNSTVELRDFEVPQPGYGQVLVKTMATTICGSDIRCIYRAHTGKGAEGARTAGGDIISPVPARTAGRTAGRETEGWRLISSARRRT